MDNFQDTNAYQEYLWQKINSALYDVLYYEQFHASLNILFQFIL